MNRTNHPVSCVICNVKFKGGNKAKYCTNCAFIKCVLCDTLIRVTGKRRKSFKYCSRSCHGKSVLASKETQAKIKHPTGKNHPNWKGGKTTHQAGYVLLNIGNKKFFEHRVIMEKYLGRKLDKKEHVHHINGVKNDNRIENLMLFPDSKAHAQYHIKVNGLAHP